MSSKTCTVCDKSKQDWQFEVGRNQCRKCRNAYIRKLRPRYAARRKAYISEPQDEPTLSESNFGYMQYFWPGHDLRNAAGHVFEHRLVAWQETGYDPRVLELFVSGEIKVHHKNGIKHDNNPANLQMRLGHNKAGSSREDWIHLLRLDGYVVIGPEKL